MPSGADFDDYDQPPRRLSLWQRFLAALPSLRSDGQKTPLVERFKEAVVKPVEPSPGAKAKAADVPLTVEELEQVVRSADDKERLTGLLLAPAAAAIAIFVVNLSLRSNPAAYLSNGAPNPRHANPSTIHDLALVLLVLAVGMLGTAFYRKRLVLGIIMALYGLSIFNLHYWGFGVPYIMAGAWLLVRAYRAQRDLREAKGEGPSRSRTRRAAPSRGPSPNKRYTPPTPPRRAPTKRKPEDEKKAG
jgi:hypothetical protein